ncbi:MAG: hypothetical protein ABH852_05565 [Methanobacteriota archaeon]
MNERGQVFTIDMFLALVLTALVVSYSGLALEQARRQAEEYSFRYSLERTANDAADVLVKTSGRPINWAENLGKLETIGIMENDSDGNPIPNSLSMRRFENLKRLCSNGNWTALTNAAQAVRNLFNNSENFEITLLNEITGENIYPPIYPRWDTKDTSGAENSLEVVVVKRIVGTGVKIENITENIVHSQQPEKIKMYFEVEPNELDTRDWYIVLNRATSNQPVVDIWVNRGISGPANSDFKSPGTRDPPFRVLWHGINYPDGSDYGFPENLHEGTNFISTRVVGQGYPVDIYVLSLPRCSQPQFLLLPDFATLEVKLWR